MITYEELLMESDRNHLVTKEKPLPISKGRIKGNRIAIRQDLTEKEKKCVLAEELGHHYTAAGEILDQSSVSNRKQELRGRAFAYNKLVGLTGIVGAYKHGCTSITESAEYLDVTEKADADLGYGKVEADGSVLNMRSGPGTSFDRTRKIPDGTKVKLTGMDSGWFKIEYNGGQGYVSSEYIAICSEKAESGKYETAQARGQNTTGSWGNGTSSLGVQIVEYGKTFLGTPYVYGGNGPDSFDCSGFTKYVYSHFGYKINRTASSQMTNGSAVSSGDLIFFRNPGDGKAASHVGIYIGDGKFVHASSDRYVVEIDTLNSSYNSRTYVGARRVI